MALFSLPAEIKSFARAIYDFQRNIGHKKTSCIEFNLQKLVNHMAANEPINPSCLDIIKKKTRAILFASSCFYDSS